MVASTIQVLRKCFRGPEMISMWTPEDDQLLQRAKEGDGVATGKLLTRFEKELEKHVRQKMRPDLRGRIEPEDILQVTYLEAYLRITHFELRGPGSFVAWLKQIAMNNLRDAIIELEKNDGKKRIRKAKSAEESTVDLIASLGLTLTTPSGDAFSGEISDVIDRALRNLPEDYRRVIELYDLAGLPVAEVVTAMTRKKKVAGEAKTVYGTEGAIYMLRRRALDRLRELLGSESAYFSAAG